MYQQHIDSLKAAAEIIDSYQFANLDLGDNGQPGANVGYLPNSVERAVVTTLIPKATKTGTGENTVWTVGTGGVVTLFTVRDTGTPVDKSQVTDIDGSNGQSTEFVADLDPDSNPDGTLSNLSVPVFSLSEEEIAVDEWVTLFQMSGYYFVFPSESAGKPSASVQFRLKSGWGGGTGVSTATTLTIVQLEEEATLPVGSEITVYDYKKIFQNAVGSDEQSDVNGGSIGWATMIGSEWLVTQCTQKVNKYEATVASGSCTGAFGENLQVNNLISRSVWPYTDADPSLSGTGFLDVVNLHGLAANGGQVWIEFQQDPTAQQDPGNSAVPYSENIQPDSGQWVITNVENPVANYINVRWDGDEWVPDVKNPSGDATIHSYDGQQPDAAYTIDVEMPLDLNMLGESGGGSICLEANSRGLARIDRTAAAHVGGNLVYRVISTSSSYNGEVHEAAVAGTLSPSNSQPPTDEDIIVVDGCDVKYKRIGKAFLFGSPGETGSCHLDEQMVSEPFLNWEDLDVIGGVNYLGGAVNFERYSIKSCTKEETTPIEFGRRDVTIIEDVYCDSSNGFVKDTRQLEVLTRTPSNPLPNIGVAIDTSCLELDYTQIIYPDYPYIDYYDIIFPSGCEPCPEPSGCCTLEISGSADEQLQTSQAYCQAQYENRDDVISYNWQAGECNTGCCTYFMTDGTTSQITGTGSTECNSRGAGDFYLGKEISSVLWQDSDCASPLGCCEGGTADGNQTDQTTCENGGGVWTAGDCPVGCCTAPGTPADQKVITKYQCDEYGGTWQENSNCSGTPIGCCTVYNSSDEEIVQQENITDAECSALGQSTPGGLYSDWQQGAACPDLDGCCTGGTYDGQNVLEGVCTGGGGTWSSSPCNPSGSCDGLEITLFEVSGLTDGTCTAVFNQNGSVFINNDSALVSGTWTLNDGVLPTVQSGSITLSASGGVWSWSGTIPTWGGTATSTDSNPTCADVTGGTATASGVGSPCGSSFTGGSYSFQAN